MHWHGIALQNNMDGAMPATPEHPGRCGVHLPVLGAGRGYLLAHPHTGWEADTGPNLPLIIDDPKAPADYDAEWIVMMDGWTDGVGRFPARRSSRI